MTKQELIKHYNDLANRYEKDVLEGNIIVGQWIKKAVHRHIKLREKYEYRQDKVDRVFSHYYYLKQGGKRFKLMGWQCWIIKSMYGLYYPNSEFRVIKYALLTLSKKNGKTGFAASLALYHFLKEEKNNNPQVLLTATTAKQANLALEEVKRFISSSPAIKKRVNKRAYDLTLKKDSGNLAVFPNTPEKADGWGCSFNIADEQAAFPNKKLLNNIKSGMRRRNNPLIFQISTAGYNKDYPFFEDVEIGKRVLDGKEELDNSLFFIFQLDNEEEIHKPEAWIKSNPSLGTLLRVESLEEDYKKSKKYPSEWDEFLIKNLNYYYSDTQETWIDDDILKSNFKDFKIEDFKGCNAYCGLDLSKNRDITAFALIFEKNKHLYGFVEYYYPDGKHNKNTIRKNGIDLQKWINEGYIIDIKKRIIDLDYIFKRIEYYSKLFNIISIGYDPYNAIQLIERIKLDLGVVCTPFKQNPFTFNEPTKEIERLIFDNNMTFHKNPVTRWMFRNVYIDKNLKNNNIKPEKNKQGDSIDGVIALTMGVGQYMEFKSDENFYNELYKK